MLRFALLLGLAGFVLVGCSHGGGPVAPARRKVEFTPVPEREAVHVSNPHDYKGMALCQRCHVQGEERLGIDAISLCAQCHNPAQMKHPWRVEQPGGAGPLPLVDGREVACHTCHDPHDVKQFPHGLRDEFSRLCRECHKQH